MRALGVSKDADVRRMMQLVARLRSEHSSLMLTLTLTLTLTPNP